MKADHSWLSDPEITEINRIPAHSDHSWYLTESDCREENNSRQFSLDGEWYFCWARTPEEGDKTFFRKDAPLEEMGKITVPGHMELAGYGSCHYTNTTYPWDGSEALLPPAVPVHYNPTGRYVKLWQMPEDWRGERIHLTFLGAESALYVWVNGSFVGYSEDSFTPAEFDITPFVTPGENRIAAEVVHFCSGSWLEDQDFFRFSGLFRGVVVEALPALHLRDLFVHTELPEKNRGPACLRAELEIEGEEEAGTVRARLLSPEGEKTAEGESALGEPLFLRVENPRLWSGEDPARYTLEIRLFDREGSLWEIALQKVGFRDVRIENGILKLNGRRIVFRGVNRHEFSCVSGRAITEQDMLWDIRFLKEHNINAVRTSHYPNQSLWYELCDRFGIYLIDETNLESHGTWAMAGREDPSHNVPGSDPRWRKAALDRARNMLERDKNHPSVLLWSLGNESYAGENMRAMTELFHRRDPGRPVHYEGVCHCRAFEDINDVESRMYLPPEGVREYLEGDPKKPFISCEYMHAMGNSCGGMASYTQLEDRYPMFQGGFIWDYMDQAILTETEEGEPYLGYGGDFDDRPTAGNFSGDGILYADRKASPKAAEVKALYAPVRLTVTERGVRVENRQFFADTSRYCFVAEWYREGTLLDSRALSVPVLGPGESETLPHGFGTCGEGETTVRVLALLGREEELLPAGHEVSFGEWNSGHRPAAIPRPLKKQMEIVPGEDVLGVRGEDFLIRFPKLPESAVSLRYGDREYLTRTPRLLFWRALTDNDRGNRQQYRLACWQAAQNGQIQTGCDYVVRDGELTVRYTFALPGLKTSPGISYTVHGDGSLSMEALWPGQENLPELPAFGLEFRMKRETDRVRYYGLGPEENYTDRRSGVRLGWYETTAAGSMAEYLKPQECGNHTGVRQLAVTDPEGRGLLFTAEEEPFEASVLPWSAEELEGAWHQHELAKPRATWVRLLACQQGVGGIDSWGSLTEEESRIPSDAPRRLWVRISPAAL